MPALLALVASVLYGAADFAGGRAARRAPVLAVTALSQATGLLLMLGAVPWLAPLPAGHGADVAWGVLAGLSGASGVSLLYRGLATAPASIVAPVSAILAVALPVATAIGLGERPAPAAWAGIVLAAVAIVLVSAAPGGDAAGTGSRRRALRLATGSGLCFGVFFVALGRTSAASGVWPLIAARAVSSTAAGLLAWRLARRGAPAGPTRGALPAIVVCGTLDTTANLLYQLAVRDGALSIVATLANLYPASTVALSAVLLRERPRPVQVAGLALALVAIVAITAH